MGSTPDGAERPVPPVPRVPLRGPHSVDDREVAPSFPASPHPQPGSGILALVNEAQRQQWQHSKSEARKEMLKLASSGESGTYTQLADALTTKYAPNGAPFAKLLSEISKQTYLREKVLLSAVIVHSDDGLPGDGFFDLAEDLGEDCSDRTAFWKRAVADVFRHYAGAST
jgi:hypothetical protein